MKSRTMMRSLGNSGPVLNEGMMCSKIVGWVSLTTKLHGC